MPLCIYLLFLGVSFHQWYKICREKFVVSSELTLKTHLTEFKDHQLVKIRKDTDGQDLIGIPLEKEELQLLVAQLENS